MVSPIRSGFLCLGPSKISQNGRYTNTYRSYLCCRPRTHAFFAQTVLICSCSLLEPDNTGLGFSYTNCLSLAIACWNYREQKLRLSHTSCSYLYLQATREQRLGHFSYQLFLSLAIASWNQRTEPQAFLITIGFYLYLTCCNQRTEAQAFLITIGFYLQLQPAGDREQRL